MAPGQDHQTLRVRLVQAASSLDPEENRRRLSGLVAHAEPGELVVFPEVFARDFGSPTATWRPSPRTSTARSSPPSRRPPPSAASPSWPG
ncbi:hypothetical protein [Nocardioides jishulii]|uniref:hypothetical protein n=1 Tax=Nocardioides jishulii TaxID=2575440 RepID=UPI001EF01E44|nr:hypothetical protein [Nocardioides jishulii]